MDVQYQIETTQAFTESNLFVLKLQCQGIDLVWCKIDALPQDMPHIICAKTPPHRPTSLAPVFFCLIDRLQAEEGCFLRGKRAQHHINSPHATASQAHRCSRAPITWSSTQRRTAVHERGSPAAKLTCVSSANLSRTGRCVSSPAYATSALTSRSSCRPPSWLKRFTASVASTPVRDGTPRLEIPE